MLVFLMASVVAGSVPFQPLRPEWVTALSTALQATGAPALLAVLMIRCAELMNFRSGGKPRSNRLILQLTTLIAAGWLLLIPTTLIAANQVLVQKQLVETARLSEATAAGAAIRSSTNSQELRQALSRIVQAQTIPLSSPLTFEQQKAQAVAFFNKSLDFTQNSLKAERESRQKSLWALGSRTILINAILVMGFAEVGGRWAPSRLIARKS